jgi:dynein heavy chain
MYINVITTAFEQVGTVQAAVELFNVFWSMSKRERIRSFVQKKALDVQQIFLNELNNVKREFEHFRKKPILPIVQGYPPYAGVALWAKGLRERLQRQWEDVELLHCALADGKRGSPLQKEHDSCRDAYTNLKDLLEGFVLQTFNAWVAELKTMDDGNLMARLNQPLLSRPSTEPGAVGAKGKIGLLENNFDRGLLKVFQEVYYWEKIQGENYHQKNTNNHFRNVHALQLGIFLEKEILCL